MGDGVFARLKHLNIELKSGRRHTSSTVYHVFRGKGATVIDNTRYPLSALGYYREEMA